MKYFAVATTFAFALLLMNSVDAKGRKTVITGTVMDLYCHVTMDMGGSSHKSCAKQCADGGAPLAIKDDKTGTIYIAAGHQKNMAFGPSGLEKYLEQRVSVSGTIYERDGLKMIVVDSATPAK